MSELTNQPPKSCWDDIKEPGIIGKLFIGAFCVLYYSLSIIVGLVLLAGLVVWLFGFVAHPETILPYLGNMLFSLFYGLSWWIAPISAYLLFSKAGKAFLPFSYAGKNLSRLGKLLCAALLLASAGCILDSLAHPSHGHGEYSAHGTTWVDDDDE